MTSTNFAKIGDIQSVERHVKNFLDNISLINTNINIDPGALNGENYLGQIARVHIRGVDKKGDPKSFNIIVKSAPTKTGIRSTLKLEAAYIIEIFFYEKMLPTFEQFQISKNIKEPFKSYPQCHYTCKNYLDEVLLLEDMKERGFFLPRGTNALNYDHILIVLKTYAKFHAVSFAIRDQKPDVFENLKEGVKDLYFDANSDETLNVYMSGTNRDLLKALEDEEDQSIREKIVMYTGKSVEIMKEASREREYCVFTHGDCWINNYLFKYEDNGKVDSPVDMCLLDFQFSYLGSPAGDLSFFLFANIEKEILEDYHDFFLDYYHKSLSDSLQELKSDPKRIFPREALTSQMKKYGVRGIFAAVAAIRFLLIKSDLAPDINASTDIDDLVNRITNPSQDNELYYRRLKDMVKICEKFEYI